MNSRKIDSCYLKYSLNIIRVYLYIILHLIDRVLKIVNKKKTILRKNNTSL